MAEPALSNNEAPILDLMAAIRASYPGASPEQIKAALSPAFLAEAYGEMPDYSTLSAPTLHPVKTAAVGSFVICHGSDSSGRIARSEPVVVLVKRGDTGPDGEDRFGVLGGYTDLGTETKVGEQPKEGAVRELMEEAVNDQGEPVLNPTPDRLQLLASGIDYRNPALPVNYNGHSLELTTRELAALRAHSEKLESDPAYQEAVRGHTHGEVTDLRIAPISEILRMPKDSFTYPHEFDAVAQLGEQLKQQRVNQR